MNQPVSTFKSPHHLLLTSFSSSSLHSPPLHFTLHLLPHSPPPPPPSFPFPSYSHLTSHPPSPSLPTALSAQEVVAKESPEVSKAAEKTLAVPTPPHWSYPAQAKSTGEAELDPTTPEAQLAMAARRRLSKDQKRYSYPQHQCSKSCCVK